MGKCASSMPPPPVAEKTILYKKNMDRYPWEPPRRIDYWFNSLSSIIIIAAFIGIAWLMVGKVGGNIQHKECVKWEKREVTTYPYIPYVMFGWAFYPTALTESKKMTDVCIEWVTKR